uniref:RNA-directed DNA polymerase, eukaryota n=1 Tax=Tanacetum cinerariifolium TaxID=118510 RepID=A0A6L2KLC3_TANCI|nr:RNA-directed DNA polymerase, eukaryota [Tanacetum cinerariifolium]
MIRVCGDEGLEMGLMTKVELTGSTRWVSDLNGDGVFRVKDVRNLLDEFFLPRADVPARWVKNIPIKVNIFVWRLALDRLPTRANLVQRNVVTESQSCPLCDAILEDTSHLFFNCSLARDVARLLCRWWNLGVQTFSSFAEWLVWFNSVRLASNLKVCRPILIRLVVQTDEVPPALLLSKHDHPLPLDVLRFCCLMQHLRLGFTRRVGPINFPISSPSGLSNETSALVNARVNWKETTEAHVFKADLPRMKKEEVKVEVEDDMVL